MLSTIAYSCASVGGLLLIVTLYQIFMVLPDEASQGPVYRILFFHVPAWWTAFLAVGVGSFASIMYLIRKTLRWDSVAVAATEAALPFLMMGIVLGSIWGRVAWGIWWTWDARLTSALVCWLLYAGYLMLRKAIEEPTQRATFAAVFSIFAFIDVPIVIFSIKWWRTQHPAPVFWGGGSMPRDWFALWAWNVLAMMLVGFVFVAVRLRQEEFQREIDSLRREAHAL